MDNTLAAAKAIVAARRDRTPLNSLGPEIAPQDEAEGYRIQHAVHDLLLPYFGAMVGYKIGCTSAVMQQYLDIPHPCGGGVFAKGVHDSGASLRAGDFVRVGVECEIAVRLARDLPASEAPFTAEWVARGDRGLSTRRSRSSMTATSNGRRWARRRWWRTTSLPPAACSARRSREPTRPICSR